MQPKILRDPLGNSIQIPSSVLAACGRGFYDLQKVVTSPAYMIQIGVEELYFIRLLDWEVNVLIEAKVNTETQEFLVHACRVNPAVEYISFLLEKGRLIPFL